MKDTKQYVKIPFDQVKTVAIIGGGASGAIVLDTLLKEKHFQLISLFERRDKLGGIWCLDKIKKLTPHNVVKPGAKSDTIDPKLNNPLTEQNCLQLKCPPNKQERFDETPSYEGMKTNIVEDLMTYSDRNKWFPETELAKKDSKYVDRAHVQRYLEQYILRNKDLNEVDIQLSTTVEDIERVPKMDGKGAKSWPYAFKVYLRKSREHDDFWFEREFDAVVVATGHYHIPYIPPVKGLDAAQNLFPGKIEHAKYFRNATKYKNKSVVIVGSRASGADLTKLIAEEATIVYQSIRSYSNTKVLSTKGNVVNKPEIREIFSTHTDLKIVFDDGSIVRNPDFVIYATGYQFSYPFLNSLFDRGATLDGIIMPRLYQHTFMIDDFLVNFVGVPIDGISLRVFEYQAILLSRFLSGKVVLPPIEQQELWTKELLVKKGIGRAYHTIGVDDALDYIKTLVALGEPKEGYHGTGRLFPPLEVKDVEYYKESTISLRKNWDNF